MRARVAIQLVSTGGVYGAEKALLELADYLRDRGWQSFVVALEGHGASDLVRRALAQGLAAHSFVPAGRMAIVPMLLRLRRLLAAHPRAVVHSHGYKPDVLLALLNAPHRLACVSTCHSWYSETTKLRILEAADKRVLRRFDHVVAVSEEIRSELLASGVAEERVTLINNGISAPPVEPAAREQVRAELGRLTDQAAGSGLGRQVHFIGYRSDVPRLLCAADAMVVSSDKEGLPITILEAMALRCPIVSTAVGAIPDALEKGTDAWVVPPNDAVLLAAAINEALNNPTLARARSESAYQRFRLGYSRDAMGRAYHDIYDNVWRARGWG